jgi:hypothetical protein
MKGSGAAHVIAELAVRPRGRLVTVLGNTLVLAIILLGPALILPFAVKPHRLGWLLLGAFVALIVLLSVATRRVSRRRRGWVRIVRDGSGRALVLDTPDRQERWDLPVETLWGFDIGREDYYARPSGSVFARIRIMVMVDDVPALVLRSSKRFPSRPDALLAFPSPEWRHVRIPLRVAPWDVGVVALTVAARREGWALRQFARDLRWEPPPPAGSVDPAVATPHVVRAPVTEAERESPYPAPISSISSHPAPQPRLASRSTPVPVARPHLAGTRHGPALQTEAERQAERTRQADLRVAAEKSRRRGKVWRVAGWMIFVVPTVVGFSRSCAHTEQVNRQTSEALQNTLQELAPPSWTSCHINIGVAAAGAPPGGAERVQADVATVATATGFDLQVVTDPAALLQVTWDVPPPSSYDAQEPQPVVSDITADSDKRISSAVVHLDPAADLDTLDQDFTAELGRVLIGRDTLSNVGSIPVAVSVPALSEELGFDVNAARDSALNAGCTPSTSTTTTTTPRH